MPENERPMTLEQFYKEEQSRLLAFKMAWLKAHHQNAEHFPIEMLPGEWDEALLMFEGDDYEVEQSDQDEG